MINAWTIWTLSALLFLIFEAMTPGAFFFLSFCPGSLFAAIASFFGYGFNLQAFIFIIGTSASFLLLKSFAHEKKLSCASYAHSSSNIDALYGRLATALESIEADKVGQVKLEGEAWSAKNLGSKIELGDKVFIVKVEGNRLLVRKQQ